MPGLFQFGRRTYAELHFEEPACVFVMTKRFLVPSLADQQPDHRRMTRLGQRVGRRKGARIGQRVPGMVLKPLDESGEHRKTQAAHGLPCNI